MSALRSPVKATILKRVRCGVATAGASLATAVSGAGATCASGQCGQGCGYACGIIGALAAAGIAGTALKRKWSAPQTPDETTG